MAAADMVWQRKGRLTQQAQRCSSGRIRPEEGSHYPVADSPEDHLGILPASVERVWG